MLQKAIVPTGLQRLAVDDGDRIADAVLLAALLLDVVVVVLLGIVVVPVDATETTGQISPPLPSRPDAVQANGVRVGRVGLALD